MHSTVTMARKVGVDARSHFCTRTLLSMRAHLGGECIASGAYASYHHPAAARLSKPNSAQSNRCRTHGLCAQKIRCPRTSLSNRR